LQVEVIGGAWRIPKVQDFLLQAVKRTALDKTLNGDEAFCFGAALYAAR
jgi:molecular chaperone DnaK (HSP70)